MQRDTDVPDIGYHYAPIDYAWRGNNLSSSLVISNGTAIAIYGQDGTILQAGGVFVSEGTAPNMNHLFRYDTVQELMYWLWDYDAYDANRPLFTYPSPVTNNFPGVKLRFTEVSTLAGVPNWRGLLSATNYLSGFSVENSQLWNVILALDAGGQSATMPVGFTNSLWHRTMVTVQQGRSNVNYISPLTLYNNTFRAGTLILTNHQSSLTNWNFFDNLFDQTSLMAVGTNANGYNGYFVTTNLAYSSGGNVTVTNVSYQAGALGSFYILTNSGMAALLNAGSRNATNAGLYHFTMTPDNVRETNSVVDIGFHYAVVSDANGDGIGDYLQDLDQDGMADAWENQYFGNLSRDGTGDYDGDGVSDLLGTDPTARIDLVVYTPLK